MSTRFFDAKHKGEMVPHIEIVFESEVTDTVDAKPDACVRVATAADKLKYIEAWGAYETAKLPAPEKMKATPEKKPKAGKFGFRKSRKKAA